MTPILLPLAASLAALGINVSRPTPATALAPGNVATESWSSQQQVDPPAVAYAVDSVIAGSSYPDEFRWTSAADSGALDSSGRPMSQARVVAGDRAVVAGLAAGGDSPDDAFSWTSGVGVVGIGFSWRFR